MSSVSEDGDEKPLREIENELMDLFEYEHPRLVSRLVLNRDKIVWVTRWRKAEEDRDARAAIEREMIAAGHRNVLTELRSREEATATDGTPADHRMKLDLMDLDVPSAAKDGETQNAAREGGLVGGLQPKRLINLENLVFDQGNHLMTNPNVKLPQGSTSTLR